jgi:hypothetical protein
MREFLARSIHRSLVPLFLACIALFLLTPPAQAQSMWKFMVVGDTRGTSAADQINTTVLSELSSEILKQAPVFVLVPGDLVYSGNLSAFQSWTNIMTPVYQADIGVFPVIGNHDAGDPTAFANVFGPTLPVNGPLGEVGRTYAFTYDNVLIFGLDTYKNAGQVNQPWIDSVLNANTLPHVFAFGHMPAFKASHTDCLDDYPTQRDAFWTSLQNAGSRAYFCGHDHFYDHMRVGDGDADLNNDVHQLIVGGGGAPLTGGYTYDGANTTWSPVGIYHDMQYGYAVVEINGLTVTMRYFHRTGANTYVATSEVWTYTVGGGTPAPPPAPTGLTATAGNAQVTLNWQASAGATSYNLQRADSPSGPYTTIRVGVTGTTYTDVTVVNNRTYYYAVTAVNSAGESASSAYIGATPQAPSVPAAPTGLTAVPKKGQVRLSWTASPGAASYNVKRSTSLSGAYTTIKNGVIGTTFTDTKLRTGTTYFYEVSAVNSVGEGAYSGPVSTTVK